MAYATRDADAALRILPILRRKVARMGDAVLNQGVASNNTPPTDEGVTTGTGELVQPAAPEGGAG